MRNLIFKKKVYKAFKNQIIRCLFFIANITRYIREKLYHLHFIFRKPKQKTLENKILKEFKFNKFVFIEEFLSQNQVKILRDILSKGRFYNIKDIRKDSSKYLFDLINNKVYWYNYPPKLLSEYKFIKDKNQIIQSGILRLIADYASSLNKKSMRVETIECYITKNKKKQIWNSQWHTDGDHKSSMRCLVYLSKVNHKTRGELQVRKNNVTYQFFGKEGSCIFFKNALVEHRGINTLEDRLCLNIKLCPGFKEINKNSMIFDVNYQGNFFW